MKYHTVLTIAGSDSGGGAGIQADIKTISACGCYAASVITAVTVQNTLGVEAIHPVPVDIVRGQIRAVLTDIGADAVKIGMLHSAEVVNCISEELQDYHGSIVLDPVMVSTSGHRLIEEQAIDTLTKRLMPMARVITPNIPEAELLLASRLQSQDELYTAAQRLAEVFGVSVLLKAGHLIGETLIDIFYDYEQGTLSELPSQRVHTVNTHGTGCTLSSAMASMLAHGLPLTDAAYAAKRYIAEAIAAGADYTIGHGHGPVNHFYAFRKPS